MPQQGSQSPRIPFSGGNRNSFKSVNHFFLSKPIHVPAQNLDIAKLQEVGYGPEAIRGILEHGLREHAIFADRDPCEVLTFPSSELERYAYFMSEIERRLEVIEDIHTNMPFKKNYVKINAEIIASQIRRILELFAISFLMVTGHKKTSPHQAVGTLLGLKELIIISPEGLAKEEFGELYGKCDRILHSENPFTPHRRQESIKFSFEFNKWLNKIRVMLGFHAIFCPDGKICQRLSDNAGKKFVALIAIDSNKSITVNQVIVTKSKEDRDEYFKGSHSDINPWIQELEKNL